MQKPPRRLLSRLIRIRKNAMTGTVRTMPSTTSQGASAIEPRVPTAMQPTQENIIRLMLFRILRASYRAFFSSGSVL